MVSFTPYKNSKSGKSCEMEHTVFRPYPRRLECLIISRLIAEMKYTILLKYFKTLSRYYLPLSRQLPYQLSWPCGWGIYKTVQANQARVNILSSSRESGPLKPVRPVNDSRTCNRECGSTPLSQKKTLRNWANILYDVITISRKQ